MTLPIILQGSLGAALRRAGALMCLVVLVSIVSSQPCHGELEIDGDRLTASTRNIRVVFQAGEIIEVTNRITGQRFAYGLGRREPVTAVLRPGDRAEPLRSDGWRRGRPNEEGREAAQTVLRSSQYTLWMNVLLDKETEDVVVGTWGDSRIDGLQGHRIGIRNLDTSTGKLIVPTRAGLEWGARSGGDLGPLLYPSEWVAQMLVWQGAEGGLVVYSRDNENRFKGLRLWKRGNYADIALLTFSDGPWESQSTTPFVEWRINAYEGSWQVPAAGYRRLMSFLWPRSAPPEGRLWAGQVERCLDAPEDLNRAWLRKVAADHPPARTLILVDAWAEGEAPQWRLRDNAARFIDAAHELGLFVAIPMEFQRASEKFVRSSGLTAASYRTIGSRPEDAVFPMNPAFPSWRRALVRCLRETLGGSRPDAILIRDLMPVANERDPSTGMNSMAGMVELLRDLQKAFPDIVLAGDAIHESVVPWVRLVRDTHPAEQTGHPITRFLFEASVALLDR